MTDAAAGLPPRPPITFTTKALYGLGAAANIIKQRGITTFLLLFYNQSSACRRPWCRRRS